MAKTETKTPDKPKATPKAPRFNADRIVMPGGIHADDLEVLEGDIDSRLAALLKDHEAMGARPK